MSLSNPLRAISTSHWGWFPGLLIVVIGVWIQSASALILVGRGNDPVQDNNWPAGSLAVANLKTRVGWWEGPPFGGGQHNFLYRGNTDDLQKAVDAFGKINAPKLELYVNADGPASSEFLKDEKDPKSDTSYNWSFIVWNPQSWNHLYNNPQSQFSAEDPNGGFRETVSPPRMEVFVGGPIDFAKITVPKSVTVIDERADANGYAGGSAVVGQVFDISTSKPIVGAKLTLAVEAAEDQWQPSASADSDAQGNFAIRKAPKGSFGLLASAPGYAPRVVGYTGLGSNTFKRFVVRLATEATLQGTARDTDGKPVQGATIRADAVTSMDGRGYILPRRAQTKTDAQGHFKLSGLPKGHTQLFAYAEHYLGVDVLKLHTIPEGALVVRLTKTGTIKGRVIDKAGQPATHGNVEIEPAEPGSHIGKWGASGNTKEDGTFEFTGVPPGTYVVTAMATNPGPALKGKDPNAKTIVVKPDETTEVEVTGR